MIYTIFLGTSSKTPKSLWTKWAPVDFLIIFTFAGLDSLSVRFLLSRSKFYLPYSCNIDWRLGLYFPSKIEDQWWKHFFLLRRRAFFEVLERVIRETFFWGQAPRPSSVSQRSWYLGTFEKQLVYTGQLRSPGGLDSRPFQHRNESTFSVVPSLFKKGAFPTWKRLVRKKFMGALPPAPCFLFPTVIRNGNDISRPPTIFPSLTNPKKYSKVISSSISFRINSTPTL